jgi:hypothetical protein
MKKQTLILIITCFAFLTVRGQTNTLFPNLTKVSVDTNYKIIFGYDKKTTRLINIPCDKLDIYNPLHCTPDSVFATWTLVARFKNDNFRDSLDIIYSAGMSDDPGFIIATKSNRSIFNVWCIEFYINASGTIYTSGHTNNLYNTRRKYIVQTDTVVEIKQPYYYVGLKGKTLKDITLYKDKSGNEIVAQIPSNYEIEILLADLPPKEFTGIYIFLVRTDFGLVGWLRLTSEDIYGTVLKDLYFAGD